MKEINAPRLALACFFSHPIQYFAPMLRSIAAKNELTVYYYSDVSIRGAKDPDFGVPVKWDLDLLAGYNSVFLKNYSRRQALNNRLADAVNPSVFGRVRTEKKAVVWINGWSYASDLMTVLAAFLFGHRVWLRADNPLSLELKKNRKVLWVKKLLLRYFFFPLFVDRCLYVGNQSRLFFEYYGVAPSQLIFTPHAVDNVAFAAAADRYLADIPGLKASLRLPAEKKLILFAGKYSAIKRPMDLLQAFGRLKENNYALAMVGEGSLRPEMETYIRDAQLTDVYLTGFVNQSQISAWYAAADVFVLCSESETWGLVINEVMNFSKPVIVSDTCGCLDDLVKPGENGYVFPMGDIGALADRISDLLGNESFRISAGQRSREIIRDYSVEKIADNIHEALIRAACQN